MAKTDPPLIAIPAAFVAVVRGARLVNWLQDVYPEVAAAVGVRALAGAGGRLVASARDWSLRRAVANVAIGDGMAAFLRTRGAADGTVHVIHNWVDEEAVRPVAAADNKLRRAWGLGDRFVVGYSGNLGRAHETATILGAAERLREEAEIVFLFIGGGRHRIDLESEAKAKGLPNLVFRDYQPQEALSEALAVADVHWVSLRPELEGLIVPSKFYGIAAAGRPIITVMAPDGELARLVRANNCGVTVGVGDSEGLAAAIAALRSDPGRRPLMGRNARAMLESRFSRRAALDRWNSLLAPLIDGPAGPAR